MFSATSITFNPVAASIGGDTGDFAWTRNLHGLCHDDSFTSASTNFQVYTATNNGLTTTLTLNSAAFSVVPITSGDLILTISGTGTATLTGF